MIPIFQFQNPNQTPTMSFQTPPETRKPRRYINHTTAGLLPVFDKKAALIADGAVAITELDARTAPPAVLAKLVVVVENPEFDAALYVEDRYVREFVFRKAGEGDPRPRHWLVYDRAAEFAGREYITEFLAREASQRGGAL